MQLGLKGSLKIKNYREQIEDFEIDFLNFLERLGLVGSIISNQDSANFSVFCCDCDDCKLMENYHSDLHVTGEDRDYIKEWLSSKLGNYLNWVEVSELYDLEGDIY